MSFPFNAQALVEQSRPDAPLGPFDGKAGAVLGDWLITTPNQDIIWLPPWSQRRVRLRADVRYGFDDPTLWPQSYVIEYPHLGAIPRKPDDPNDPLSIMWWNPSEFDFVPLPNNLVNGLGQLAQDKCKKFDICRRDLIRKVDEYKAKTNSPNYYLLTISKAMNHAGIRLGCLPSSFQEMKFGVTEFQRYYLETLGLHDYLAVYKPRIDGSAARSSLGANHCVGVFTGSARVAQEFYEAGLPVWFIRETRKIAENPDNAPNVLKLVEARQPEQYLTLADCNPPFPDVYKGFTNKPQKYAAIHAFSRTWMVYRDPFSEERPQTTENPEDPFYSHKRPAAYSVTIPMSELMRERLPSTSTRLPSEGHRVQQSPTARPYPKERHAEQIPATQLPSAGRDKFVDPDSPLFPPAATVWANALKNVDKSSQRIKKDAPKNLYALPEPALFVTPSNDQKKISYLMTWLKSRPAWLWHLESQSNTAVSAQMWRDLLGMNFNQGANNQTLAGKRREQIQKMIGTGLDKPGLSYSSAAGGEPILWHGVQLTGDVMPPLPIVHAILWEIYELNFRCELLALDRRLSRDHDQQRIAACFSESSGGLTFVMPSAEDEGLVSGDWRTRLHYFRALVRVMRNWNIEELPSVFALVESRSESITKEQALEMECAAASFYAQQFFNHFGRAPAVPHRLLD